MNTRPAVVRAALMVIRRRKRKEGDTEAVEAINAALWCSPIFEMLAESVCAQHASQAAELPGNWADFIKDLFAWLLENQEEIIAFIKMLIELFS